MADQESVWVDIGELTISNRYQMRVALNGDIVTEYSELIGRSKDDWPFKEPCHIYRVSGKLILVDGFHRVAAMKKSDKDQVFVEIHDGSASDALRAAFSANGSHGLRLTNADKRNKVTIALSEPEFAKLSDHKLAELCGVSQPFVGQIRAELITVIGSAPEDRTGADGVERPASAESAADQRKRIKAAIKEHPEWSNRKIAELIGCSDKTVAGVRRSLAGNPEPVQAVMPVDAAGEPDLDDDGNMEIPIVRGAMEIFIDATDAIKLLLMELDPCERVEIWQQIVADINAEDIEQW